MIVIRPTQPEEMLRRHQAAGRKRATSAAVASPVHPQPRNVEPILSLGDTDYVLFRGRAYGVPPLPWKAGERMADLQARLHLAIATMKGNPLDEETRAGYYAALAKVPPLLWAHSRPTGKWRRFLRALGLHRNPFDGATDRELLELLDFFSSRRTRSGVPAPPMMARPARRTS